MKRDSTQLTIGELARRAGVKVSTVRVYERDGLLLAPGRSTSNYRLYDEEAVARIRFARRAQQLGFTLAEIKGLLGLRVNKQTSCAEVRQLAEAKIADIEGRIRSLQVMRRALAKLAAACDTHRNSSACPLLEHLETDFES